MEIGNPEIDALLAASRFRANPGYHSGKEGHILIQHHRQGGRFEEYPRASGRFTLSCFTFWT